ncbi:hypothetical protein IEQ34_004330 [Dendrobium chrysotoxum]|uniref:Acidic leucine-rich nuclear phosphoprotein 32-related protein n=1 Tax=Dendrobium chrysotoxum TaxID=161865 RepID=A0AAV7HFL4_DENCH|nr:hypothetical protein IEQ34_004330 [Dendrobium chrysotoxum]
MDEVWERAVEAKLEGQATPSSELRVLNLDGAVKSLHGCLPPAGLLERFPGLEHLSIANVGATSLERFPRLRNLQRLILSDNRIAGGLESLVDAGLQSLRDLDLSNNRIQHIEDLAPLAALHLVSLDLYECPVTRVNDYRSKVFAMIRTLKYLDKLDANENERPESDDEEEEDEEEYDDDEEDSGSGEVDGGDQTGNLTSGARNSADGDEGIVDADEDEGSDADEEEIETNGRRTGSGSSVGSGHHLSNGFRMTATAAASVEGDEHDGDDDVEDEDDDEEDDDDLGEEIDEDEAEYEDDAAEMHNILDSDEEDEDGVDEVEIDEEEIDEEDVGDDEEVDEDDDDMGAGDEEDAEPASTGRLANTEGEIDGHDHGEEDENGEIGEEDEQGVEDRDVEEDYGESEDEDDLDGEYLVQPIARSSWPDSSHGNEEDEIDYEDENRPSNGTLNQSSSSSDANKRKRDEEGHLDNDKTEERRPSKRR